MISNVYCIYPQNCLNSAADVKIMYVFYLFNMHFARVSVFAYYFVHILEDFKANTYYQNGVMLNIRYQ